MSKKFNLSEVVSDYYTLSKLYNNDINEATIKLNIVVEFLKKLGYNSKFFSYEDRQICKGSVDIAILDPFTKETLIHVETKKQKHSLSGSDCAQLCNYLNSKNIEWGILTNGNEYILLNNNVDGMANQKCVLKFYLKNSSPNHLNKLRNSNNLNYFSYEYLIDKKLTNYFISLASFRNKTENISSFRQYESTVYNYLDFLCKKFDSFDLVNINPNTLEEFVIRQVKYTNAHNNKKANYQETIINKYAYVSNFYKKSIESSEKRNPFSSKNQKDFLSGVLLKIEAKELRLKGKKINDNFNPLTDEELSMIVGYKSNSRNFTRDKLIVLLFIYCAIDRNELIDLKVDNLDLMNKQLIVNDRNLPLPNIICDLATNYIEARQKEKISTSNLFYTTYNTGDKRPKPIDSSTINHLIKNYFKSFNIDDNRKALLTPTFFKRSLLIRMYTSKKIHIEEILKFTGLTLSSISKYITDEQIKSTNISNLKNKHPYKDVI